MNIRSLAYVALMINVANVSAQSAPYICFTDLTSGPRNGNSDDSQPGQVAGVDGAIVTLWGKRLGSVQGSSGVLVGGVSARVYSWGNATGPADLYSTLGLQMVVFQIPGSLSNGPTTVQVIVDGVTSNTLPFKVRNGDIYFVKTTGNDATGDGSWSQPWATLDNVNYNGALEKISTGDIVYVGDGVTHTACAGDNAAIDLGPAGTASHPKAIVGYPGANAWIGSTAYNRCYALWVSGFGPTQHWTISKLNLVGKNDAADMYHGFRVVGNRITAPLGDEPTGAVAGQGNHLYLLGNELTDIGYQGTSKLYHPIYIQSAEACSGTRLPTETDRELAWNYLHDNYAHDGINIYRECGSSAYMTDHRIHDNWIAEQTGVGIRCGDYVVGENWIYNNVLVNTGLGPDPTGGDEAMHVPLYIHAGWDDTTTTIHCYNNTIYGGGYTDGAAWSSSMVAFAFNHPFDLDFRNNIVVSTVPGIGYWNPAFTPPGSGVENNLWYGAGAAPSWDASPIGADPLFADPNVFDLRLQAASPALDAALPLVGTPQQPLPAFDFDAVERPQGLAADLGAFEAVADISTWIDERGPSLSMYPVPAGDLVFVRSEAATSGSVFRITDAAGRTMLSGRVEWNGSIDVRRLGPGMYMLELHVGTRNQASCRFVKQ